MLARYIGVEPEYPNLFKTFIISHQLSTLYTLLYNVSSTQCTGAERHQRSRGPFPERGLEGPRVYCLRGVASA